MRQWITINSEWKKKKITKTNLKWIAVIEFRVWAPSWNCANKKEVFAQFVKWIAFFQVNIPFQPQKNYWPQNKNEEALNGKQRHGNQSVSRQFCVFSKKKSFFFEVIEPSRGTLSSISPVLVISFMLYLTYIRKWYQTNEYAIWIAAKSIFYFMESNQNIFRYDFFFLVV